MDKTTLLDMLIANHTRFEGILAQINPAKMLEPLEGKDELSPALFSMSNVLPSRMLA